MMRSGWIGCLLCLGWLASCGGTAQMRVAELRCEYLIEPLGIDVPAPRFSWVLESAERGAKQTGYEVLVAAAPERLTSESAGLWHSGKVGSDRSVNVPYAGKPLASGTRYFWKVRVWDGVGSASEWSQPATFQMGLLRKTDWKAQWIGDRDPDNRAPLLRKEFRVDGEVRSAFAYVSGLGYYELYLNSGKVGDHVLDPAPTQYEKRALYATYDVTGELRQGANAAGLMLGEGLAASSLQDTSRFYSRPKVYPGPVGTPRGILQLEIQYADGRTERIITDSSWKTSTGPITFNNFYGGEDYDARLRKPGWAKAGYDDAGWSAARVKKYPGELTSQLIPPMKVAGTLTPVKSTHPAPATYVYDLGQNIAGWGRIRVKGKRGTRVSVRGAETLADKTFPEPLSGKMTISTKDHHGRGGYYFRDVIAHYTLTGAGAEVYEPRFFYNGFRYIQVDVEPPAGLEEIAVEGRAVHSAVEPAGEFQSSNELLNSIHHICLWTLKGIFHGVPMSNPHSEKYGWTGDAGLFAEYANHCFRMARFWTKWLRDIRDAQAITGGGGFPSTVPNYRTDKKPTTPAWGAAYPFITWYVYRYYDDTRILEENFDGVKAWCDYLTSTADHHIASGIWADHMAPALTPEGEKLSLGQTPELAPLVSTAYYYATARSVSEMAKALGKTRVADEYARLAEQIRRAFNGKFFDASAGMYKTPPLTSRYFPLQTANLMPLEFGMVPEVRRQAVLEKIAADIAKTHDGHLMTGILGTKALVDVLPEYGEQALLYRVATQTTYPSWGWWIEHGATTVWQNWSATGDQNHAMLGTIDEFLFNELAGIQAPTRPGTGAGYRRIHIKPFVPKGLDSASARLRTMPGQVSSEWRRTAEGLELRVTLPANTTGVVSIPALGARSPVITESGNPVWTGGAFRSGVTGVTGAAREKGSINMAVGSGSYVFHLRRGD